MNSPSPLIEGGPPPSSNVHDAQPGDVRRDKILAVATHHFATKGYQKTGVQEIADELRLGKGTIYREFSSKSGLFLAAGDRAMRLLTQRISTARASVSDPLDQIRQAVVQYLAFFDENPEFVELFIIERAVFRNRTTPTYFEHRKKNVGSWRALYLELMDAGRVRRIRPEVITNVLSSALYGTMFTNHLAGRQESLECQARQIIDVVFNGILTAPSADDATCGKSSPDRESR